MAKIEPIIEFILKWETSVVKSSGESYETYFARCKKKGFANDPADAGGATMCGVTLSTYRQFKGRASLQAQELKAITWEEWKAIFKSMYFDRWHADRIVCQSVATILVDWVWASGKYGITRPQKLLGVKADGIVGNATLSALNSKSHLIIWSDIRKDRLKFINEICAARPANTKFKNGWIRRIDDLKFSE